MCSRKKSLIKMIGAFKSQSGETTLEHRCSIRARVVNLHYICVCVCVCVSVCDFRYILLSCVCAIPLNYFIKSRLLSYYY